MSDQFLRILDNERRTAVRHVLLGLVLTYVLAWMVNLADEPLWGGRETITYLVLLVPAAGAGAAYAWWRSTRFGNSLRSGWNAWMRFSVSCASVDEVYRKAANRRPASPAVPALGAVLLAVLNVILFVLLWNEAPAAGTFALFMVVVNAASAGAWLGASAYRFEWARRFDRALEELVREGAVGVWGER